MSIAGELRKLLSLERGVDLTKIAKSAQLHFSKKAVFISFRGSNIYEIAYLTARGVLVASQGGQQYPELTALVVRLVKASLLGKTGKGFVKLELIVDPNEINKALLSGLLLALRFG